MEGLPDVFELNAAQCCAAGLTPSLQNPNATYTVLVPTNAAFAALSPALLNTSDTQALQLVPSPANC